MAAEGRPPTALIDPEALLLLSFTMSKHERRLEDMWRWWAHAGSPLTSVARIRALAEGFPDREAGMASFAASAVDQGDRRWRKYAEEAEPSTFRSVKGPDLPNLFSPPALLLRIRAGIGLGAKADILTFLICRSPRESTIAEIADATAYSTQTVRVATGDLLMAGFAYEVDERPARLTARAEAWSELLLNDHSNGSDAWPKWRHWADLFRFLVESVRWLEASENSSRYVQSSAARDLHERHRTALRMARIEMPRPGAHPGEEFLPEFNDALERFAVWLDRHL